MSLLEELIRLLSDILPVETGIFSEEEIKSEYAVLTPLTETYTRYSDNEPRSETQEVRICIFTKGNYTKVKSDIIKTLRKTEILITDRRYLGYEIETGHHQFVIDVAKHYELEEEE